MNYQQKENKLSPKDSRKAQNIFAVLLIFLGVLYLINGTFDFESSGILIILGLGVSKDTRNIFLFCLKWLFAKILKKPTPTYDFSHAKIEQHGKTNIINNGGTININ